jgi:sec-independent protein translocase protein TatB
MFDIGFWELLVIGIIALLVIGPERLPSFIRSTADTIKSIKSMANGFKEEVSQQLKTHELHENLKKAEQMGMENIGGDIKKSVDELRAAAASVQEPYKKNQAQKAKKNVPSTSDNETKHVIDNTTDTTGDSNSDPESDDASVLSATAPLNTASKTPEKKSSKDSSLSPASSSKDH